MLQRLDWLEAHNIGHRTWKAARPHCTTAHALPRQTGHRLPLVCLGAEEPNQGEAGHFFKIKFQL